MFQSLIKKRNYDGGLKLSTNPELDFLNFSGPGIDSRRAGTTTIFLLVILAPIDCSKIPSLYSFVCSAKYHRIVDCPTVSSVDLWLKVHKIENFFDFDFGICVISLLVMHK